MDSEEKFTGVNNETTLLSVTQEKKKADSEITAFRGLRGLFILMVLACHTHGMFNIGEQGVDGFLVMSGWLNAMSMDKALRANKPACTATKSFFIHRAFRILPAYYLLLIMIIIFMG